MRRPTFQLPSFSYPFSGSALLISGALLSACSGTVEVGDPGTGGAVGGDGDDPAESGGSGAGGNVGGDGDDPAESGGSGAGGNVGGDGDAPGEAGSAGSGSGAGGNVGGDGDAPGEAGSAGSGSGAGGNVGGDGDDPGEAGSTGAGGGQSGGGAGCTVEEANEAARQDEFEAWLGTENEWGDLTGTFQGYIEGGADLTLEIDSEGDGVLIVGVAAAPPVQDKGYLCEDDGCADIYSSPIDGATYPIHGATLDADRLQIGLARYSPFDPWCALQTPVPIFEENACFYDLQPNAGISWGETCSIGDEIVDCGWFHLVQLRPCRCTSEECFASVSTGSDGMKIDARYDAGEQSLRGSWVDGGTTRPLYLFKE